MDGSSSATRSVGVDALFQYTGSGVQLFSGMVFYVIAVRLFSTSGVGAIALFVAIVGLFSIIFSFGLTTAAQHFTSYDLGRGDYGSAKRTIYRILFLAIGLSFAGLAVLQSLAGEISLVFLHSYNYTELVRMLGVVLFGSIMFGILNGVLLGIQRFRISAIISILIWVTYYFGSLVFAFYLRSIDTIVFGWILGIFLGVVIELIVVLYSVRRFLGVGKPPGNTYILRYSAPILFSGIISYGAVYADRFIVSGLLSLSSLGIYNFALLIASAIGFMAFPFNNILMPKFSEYYGRGEKERIASTAQVSSTLLSYFYVPSALGIAALAPSILALLGGHVYAEASGSLRIISFFTALFVTQNILVQAIASVRRTRVFLYSSVFSLAGNVILSLTLIPPLGLIGAAIGYSSVYAITFATLYYFARKNFIISFDASGMLKVWVSAVVMFVTVVIVSDILGSKFFLLPVYIMLGALVYTVLAKALGIFRKEDKELVLSLFPPSFVRFKKVLSVLVLH